MLSTVLMILSIVVTLILTRRKAEGKIIFAYFLVKNACILCFLVLYPEFATYRAKKEPFLTPFLSAVPNFCHFYAAYEILKKCTYFYDLHENLYPCFDAF